MTIIKSFLSYKVKLEGPNVKIDNFILKNVECPQQTNGNDCGIYLLVNCRCKFFELEITQHIYEPEDAKQARKIIKCELLQKKLL